MEFKIKDIFVKAAGLKEGVHFAEKVEGVKLEIVGNQKKDDLVPIILRKEGKKVGLARIRFFRPFPTEDILDLAKNSDLIVLDRSISIGMEGPLFTEVKSSLYGKSDAKVFGYIAGLGGKDVTYKAVSYTHLTLPTKA